MQSSCHKPTWKGTGGAGTGNHVLGLRISPAISPTFNRRGMAGFDEEKTGVHPGTDGWTTKVNPPGETRYPATLFWFEWKKTMFL